MAKKFKRYDKKRCIDENKNNGADTNDIIIIILWKIAQYENDPYQQ